MLRSGGKLGFALLLATVCMVSSQQGMTQALTAAPSQANSRMTPPKTTSPSSSKSKGRGKKVETVTEAPQISPPPPTLEQQPPNPPQVSYRNGQLSIDSQNATLSQVLRSVQAQTGASVDIPPGAGSERVSARLGPGQPKDVIANLLNGSKFNYVILGVANNSGGVQKVILMANSTPGGAPIMTQNNGQQPPPPQAEPSEDDTPQYEPEPEVQQMPVQPGGMVGGEQVAPDGTNNGANPAQPGGRTPEQMLQELQRMQQQQQQYQQQLNPSNQGPFPNQPQVPPQ
jgi:hypothetical protein